MQLTVLEVQVQHWPPLVWHLVKGVEHAKEWSCGELGRERLAPNPGSCNNPLVRIPICMPTPGDLRTCPRPRFLKVPGVPRWGAGLQHVGLWWTFNIPDSHPGPRSHRAFLVTPSPLWVSVQRITTVNTHLSQEWESRRHREEAMFYAQRKRDKPSAPLGCLSQFQLLFLSWPLPPFCAAVSVSVENYTTSGATRKVYPSPSLHSHTCQKSKINK